MLAFTLPLTPPAPPAPPCPGCPVACELDLQLADEPARAVAPDAVLARCGGGASFKFSRRHAVRWPMLSIRVTVLTAIVAAVLAPTLIL